MTVIQSFPAATQNAFLDRLRAGESTFMLSIRCGRTSDVVRIAHSTGHHCIMVDLEHSAISLDVAAELCGTANDLGMTPFVRIPERDYGIIGRLMDGGASGIVAPRVETATEATTISRACRFPPRGQRSQITMVPQLGMQPTPARVLNPALDNAAIVKLLLETPQGIENADSIAAVDGVDILAIGANDLCAELGSAGNYKNPLLREAVETVAAACRKHNKLMMVGGIGDLSILGDLMPLGACSLLLTGTDADILFTGAGERVRRMAEWRDASETRLAARQ